MDLPRRKPQSCGDCQYGPAYAIQRGSKCQQQIDTRLWDGVRNSCQYHVYVPGSDVEYDGDGRVSN